MRLHVLSSIAVMVITGCGSSNSPDERSVSISDQPKAGIGVVPFGQTQTGVPTKLYTLTNEQGLDLTVTDYGGTITSLMIPDREGQRVNVMLGFESLAEYEADSPYFGAIIGRYAGRIAKGRFSLDGEDYSLATNNGPNHLHGGVMGFDKKVWAASTQMTADGPQITFSLVSPDGDQGYPGALSADVKYTWTNENELVIDYRAVTDQATPVNLTQHAYFNLSGDIGSDILDHELIIDADQFTPLDETLIPTGEIAPVEGTALDFRHPKPVGRDIEVDSDQMRRGNGYDHNWVLNKTNGAFEKAATLYHPGSGRVMEVWTDEPGIQVYTGNFLSGQISTAGTPFARRSGICLETQHFPDSPNQAGFPSTILRPGEVYQTRTMYRFSLAE